MKITLKGNPQSTNHIYKITSKPFPHVYLTANGRAIKEGYVWEAISQKSGKTLSDNLSIEVDLYFGDKRKRDIDNHLKIALDALTDAKVWEDDKQIMEAIIRKKYDKENPRIEIAIRVKVDI